MLTDTANTRKLLDSIDAARLRLQSLQKFFDLLMSLRLEVVDVIPNNFVFFYKGLMFTFNYEPANKRYAQKLVITGLGSSFVSSDIETLVSEFEKSFE